MASLAPVLRVGDLPLAELCAARLDGELVGIDECFSPIDVHTGPFQRAAALTGAWSPRLIAEQRTAAWVWGATADSPARHQLCASVGARARALTPHRSVVREVVIDDDEIVLLASVRVTAPLRTVTDLARFSTEFTESEAEIVRQLLAGAGLGIDDCARALDRRRNLPAKKLALARLRGALPDVNS
jgi:hypothetical protein